MSAPARAAPRPGRTARPRPLLLRWLRRLRKWGRAIREIQRLAPRRQRALVVIGSFISSVLDLIGLTMMVPLIIAATNVQESTKGIVVALGKVLGAVGIPFSPLPILTIIVVGLALKGIVGVLVTRYVAQVVSLVTRDMRIRLIRSLLGARWSYFLKQPVGRLAFAIGPEADAAGQCFEVLASLLAACLQVLMFITILGVLSWQLLVIAIVASVVTVLWFGGLVQRGRQLAKERRHETRQRAAKFTDALIGIKPIRAMGRADQFSAIFEGEAHDIARQSRQSILSPEYSADLQEPIIGVVIAVGFYLAVTRLQLQVHDLLILSILMIRTIAALLPMQRMAQRFISSYDQFRSLSRLLQNSEEAKEMSRGTLQPTLERGVTFENVSFAYAERPILAGLDLVVAKGKITALVGPSGVGKSTLVDLLVGLYAPKSGAIRIDGVDLRDVDLARWRALIGYVPQEVLLFHDTVRNNVTLFEEGISDEMILRALETAGAAKFVSELPLGLDTVVGERGNRLSGGQRQRISIARALLHEPRLLILDEATTGLDRDAEWSICEHVRQLCDDIGLTTLAVSHQPAWQQAAHQVYRIEGGRAAAIAPLAPGASHPADSPAD